MWLRCWHLGEQVRVRGGEPSLLVVGDGLGRALGCTGVLIGDVQGSGEARTRCPRGNGVAWACRGWSGASRAGECRSGWLCTVCARRLFDSSGHDKTPAVAGKGEGQA